MNHIVVKDLKTEWTYIFTKDEVLIINYHKGKISVMPVEYNDAGSDWEKEQFSKAWAELHSPMLTEEDKKEINASTESGRRYLKEVAVPRKQENPITKLLGGHPYNELNMPIFH